MLVVRSQNGQVAAHPGLVGDDGGVLGVGLAGAPVAGRCPVDREAGDVEQLLAVVEQHADEQRGHAVRDVDRPHGVLVDGQYIGEQSQQFRLVIEHAP